MDRKDIIKSIGVAFIAQGISLALSVVTTLLVPKILGVQEFGYWQLFLLYAGYAGFFHFGLNDGVYLLNGGKSRNEMAHEVIASQFYIELAMQMMIALAIAIVSVLCFSGEERAFILISDAVYLIICNLTGYLGYVFQAANETRLFSFSTIIDRLVFLVPLTVLIALGINDYRAYIASYLAARLCALLYCIYKARDLLCPPFMPLSKALRQTGISIRVGISLMIANIAAALIIGIVRFIVDANWDVELFSKVSFAFTLINFVLVFVSQISMVLFPALKRESDLRQRGALKQLISRLPVFLPTVLLFYYPATWILSLWLPEYRDSFSYFAYLLPICTYDAEMSLIGTTYLKIMRKEKRLLGINCVSVACCSILSAIAAVLGSVELMLVVCAAVIVFRYEYTSRYLSTEYRIANLTPLRIVEFLTTILLMAFAVLGGETLVTFLLSVSVLAMHIVLSRRFAAKVALR